MVEIDLINKTLLCLTNTLYILNFYKKLFSIYKYNQQGNGQLIKNLTCHFLDHHYFLCTNCLLLDNLYLFSKSTTSSFHVASLSLTLIASLKNIEQQKLCHYNQQITNHDVDMLTKSKNQLN